MVSIASTINDVTTGVHWELKFDCRKANEIDIKEEKKTLKFITVMVFSSKSTSNHHSPSHLHLIPFLRTLNTLTDNKYIILFDLLTYP